MLPSLEHGIYRVPTEIINYFQALTLSFSRTFVLENMAHFRCKGINEGHSTVSIL